ncbi:hypothetical protein KRM28CT15_41850 [Krasilnikovia sp. M28-CT-15]
MARQWLPAGTGSQAAVAARAADVAVVDGAGPGGVVAGPADPAPAGGPALCPGADGNAIGG